MDSFWEHLSARVCTALIEEDLTDMTFDAFSSSKRANIRNGLARVLCAFGGALLWMALVPFGDEASAACPAWPVVGAVGDAKTISCTGTDHAADAGTIDYTGIVADGTLKLVAPLTVKVLDADDYVIAVQADDAAIRVNAADLDERSPSLTVLVGPGVILQTSDTSGSQDSVLYVVSYGGKISVVMDGEIAPTETALPVAALVRNALYLQSADSNDFADGDISLTVGGKISAVVRRAIYLSQERANGAIEVVINDGAQITTGSASDNTLGGLQVIEARITDTTNTRTLSVLIGTEVAQGTQDEEDAKGRHTAVVHVVNKIIDGDDAWTRPAPAIELVHDGVGIGGQRQIDLQVYRGDVEAFGHGIHAELGNVDAEGDIHIELGSPGWKANTYDNSTPAIESKAKTTIIAHSSNPAEFPPDPDAAELYKKQGVGVYALNVGEGRVWVLARYVDIDADMEGIRVDTTTAAAKGVLIEIGHPGTNPQFAKNQAGEVTGLTVVGELKLLGRLPSRSSVVGRNGHAIHVEYLGLEGAVEISLFAGTIENRGHNAFTAGDTTDDTSGRGIHARIVSVNDVGELQPTTNSDDIVIQVGSREDPDDPVDDPKSVYYYGAGIRAEYQSAIGASHYGLGGIEIKVTIAPDPVPDPDYPFIGSIIGAEEAIHASVENVLNVKAIRIDIQGKPAALAMLKTTGVKHNVIHAVHKGAGEDPTDDTTGDSSISISIKDSIIETEDMTVEHEADGFSDAYTTTAISSKAGIYAVSELETSTSSILVEVDGSRIKAGSPIHAVHKGLGMIAIVVENSSPGPSPRDTKEGYDGTHYGDSQALGLYANDVFYDSAEPLLREVDTLANLVDDPLRQNALESHPYVILNVGKPAVEASNGVDAVAAVPAGPAYRLMPPNFYEYGMGIHASLDSADNKEWIFVAVVNSRIEAQRNTAIRLVHRGVGSADAFPAYPRDDKNADLADLRDGGDADPKDGADRGDRVGDSIVLWIDGSVVKSRAPRDAVGAPLSPPKYLGRPIYVEEKTGDRPNVVVASREPATWDSFGSGPLMNAIHGVVDNKDNPGDLVIGVFDSKIEADGLGIAVHHKGKGNIYVLVGKDDPALPDAKHRVGAVGSVIYSDREAIFLQHMLHPDVVDGEERGADEIVVEVLGGSDIFTDHGTGIHVHEVPKKPLKLIAVKVAGIKGDPEAGIEA